MIFAKRVIILFMLALMIPMAVIAMYGTEADFPFEGKINGDWDAIYWYDFNLNSDSNVDVYKPIPRFHLQSIVPRIQLFISDKTIAWQREQGEVFTRNYTWYNEDIFIAEETEEWGVETEYVVIDNNTIHSGSSDGQVRLCSGFVGINQA